MDTNDYIDSGILELYVMHALSSEEAADVERRAASDPAVAEEIREIQEALAELDMYHTRAPRASVRASMLAKIEEDERAARAPDASLGASTIGSMHDGESTSAGPLRASTIEPLNDGEAAFTTPHRAGTIEPMHDGEPASAAPHSASAIERIHDGATAPTAPHRAATRERLPGRQPARETSRRYAMAASWIVAVLGIGAASYFALQLRDVSGELAAVQREADSIRIATSLIAHHAKVGQHAIHVMHDSAAQIINLAGTDKAPDSHLLVCYHPKSSEVHLLSNLPPPPDGKTYQLWALNGDEKIDAGTFDASRMDLIQTQKRVESVDAFAVTIENAGGSATPDLGALVAVGKL